MASTPSFTSTLRVSSCELPYGNTFSDYATANSTGADNTGIAAAIAGSVVFGTLFTPGTNGSRIERLRVVMNQVNSPGGTPIAQSDRLLLVMYDGVKHFVMDTVNIDNRFNTPLGPVLNTSGVAINSSIDLYVPAGYTLKAVTLRGTPVTVTVEGGDF